MRDSEHFIVLPPIRPERAAISWLSGLLNSLKGALAAGDDQADEKVAEAMLAIKRMVKS